MGGGQKRARGGQGGVVRATGVTAAGGGRGGAKKRNRGQGGVAHTIGAAAAGGAKVRDRERAGGCHARNRLSRPSHNLSGNGRAATSRDTGVTNRDLGASRGATRG